MAETIGYHDAEPLRGNDFRALNRISDRDDNTLAAIGETCEKVDPNALGWLLVQGHIEPVAPSPSPLERAVADDVETR